MDTPSNTQGGGSKKGKKGKGKKGGETGGGQDTAASVVESGAVGASANIPEKTSAAPTEEQKTKGKKGKKVQTGHEDVTKQMQDLTLQGQEGTGKTKEKAKGSKNEPGPSVVSKEGGQPADEGKKKGKKGKKEKSEEKPSAEASKSTGTPAQPVNVKTPKELIKSMPPKAAGEVRLWKEIPSYIYDITPPQRPSKIHCGTVGRRITLTANLFEVAVGNKDIQLYHYNVVILDHRNSETLPKKKKLQVFEKLKLTYNKIFKNAPMSYDSEKNAYSTVLIPQFVTSKGKKPVPYDVEVKFDVDQKNMSKFKVSMEKVGEASLRELFDSMKYVQGRKVEMPTTIIQMMEVMFRHYRAIKYEQVNRRNFFGLNSEFSRPLDIGGGKQGVSGFFGSFRPSGWKDASILLNLNMANTAFYKEQSVIDFLKDHERELRISNFAQTITHPTLRAVDKLLKMLRVQTTHIPRTYKFVKLLQTGADKTTFDITEGGTTRKTTIQEYFRVTYKTCLKYPQLNCVHVGNPERSIYIPMELLKIAKGQKVVKKLSDMEVASFIRSTAIPPAQRLQQIKQVAVQNQFSKDEMLNALTFTISEVPLKTEGRVLPEPGLQMDRNFKPRDGGWDIRDKCFFNPAKLAHWAVINYDRRTDMNTIERFVGMLVRMGKEKRMEMARPFDIYNFGGRDPVPLDDFQYYKKKNPDIQLIMCILPGRRYYGAIKRAGDTEVKIITQCVQAMNVMKCQPQTVANILLKINGKMDGVNNIVALANNQPIVTFPGAANAPFLIMGADVNHPPAGADKSIPSIAAVVGSYDRHATKYATERRAQYHRVEIIQDLKQITINLLKTFYASTRAKPTRIVMYRDGVSESQFRQVLADEMMAMRGACQQLQEGYNPGITFICVQKRHHIRLFCDQRDGVGKSGNIPPGTIVDKDITHPTETDFFLCSHQGIQGTSRPTHYHLLWDDNDLNIDELQQLTYRLCHVYQRCSKVVSIPAPVYYAHLAAFRAKVYVGEFIDESEMGSVRSGGSGDLSKIQDQIIRTTNISRENELSKRLYYI